MQKENLGVIIKWVTVGVLALSAVFFFLPYRGGMTVLEVLDEASKTNMTEFIIEMIFRYVVPVVLTLLAAVMMLKVNVKRSVFASVFCIIAAVIYFSFLSSYMKISIGLVLNITVAVLGVILPIACVVISKKCAAKE